MKILGVDYGKKRIGLAKAQSDVDVVLPFGIVGSIEELVGVINKEAIDKIVLGLPIGLEGGENRGTEEVKKFIKELEQKINTPIELVDERLTSKQADSMGGETSRDEKAAMIILQTYLDKYAGNSAVSQEL